MTAERGRCECGREAIIRLLDEQGRPVPVCETCLDEGIQLAIAERCACTNDDPRRGR